MEQVNGEVDASKIQNDATQELMNKLEALFETIFIESEDEKDEYFAKLISDTQEIPITEIIKAPQVQSITSDETIIKQAIMNSKSFIVSGENVAGASAERSAIEDSAIVLLNIASSTPVEEILQLFASEKNESDVDPLDAIPPVISISCHSSEAGDYWLVGFANKELCKLALEKIRNKTFRDHSLAAFLSSDFKTDPEKLEAEGGPNWSIPYALDPSNQFGAMTPPFSPDAAAVPGFGGMYYPGGMYPVPPPMIMTPGMTNYMYPGMVNGAPMRENGAPDGGYMGFNPQMGFLPQMGMPGMPMMPPGNMTMPMAPMPGFMGNNGKQIPPYLAVPPGAPMGDQGNTGGGGWHNNNRNDGNIRGGNKFPKQQGGHYKNQQRNYNQQQNFNQQRGANQPRTPAGNRGGRPMQPGNMQQQTPPGGFFNYGYPSQPSQMGNPVMPQMMFPQMMGFPVFPPQQMMYPVPPEGSVDSTVDGSSVDPSAQTAGAPTTSSTAAGSSDETVKTAGSGENTTERGVSVVSPDHTGKMGIPPNPEAPSPMKPEGVMNPAMGVDMPLQPQPGGFPMFPGGQPIMMSPDGMMMTPEYMGFYSPADFYGQQQFAAMTPQQQSMVPKPPGGRYGSQQQQRGYYNNQNGQQQQNYYNNQNRFNRGNNNNAQNNNFNNNYHQRREGNMNQNNRFYQNKNYKNYNNNYNNNDGNYQNRKPGVMNNSKSNDSADENAGSQKPTNLSHNTTLNSTSSDALPAKGNPENKKSSENVNNQETSKTDGKRVENNRNNNNNNNNNNGGGRGRGKGRVGEAGNKNNGNVKKIPQTEFNLEADFPTLVENDGGKAKSNASTFDYANAVRKTVSASTEDQKDDFSPGEPIFAPSVKPTEISSELNSLPRKESEKPENKPEKFNNPAEKTKETKEPINNVEAPAVMVDSGTSMNSLVTPTVLPVLKKESMEASPNKVEEVKKEVVKENQSNSIDEKKREKLEKGSSDKFTFGSVEAPVVYKLQEDGGKNEEIMGKKEKKNEEETGKLVNSDAVISTESNSSNPSNTATEGSGRSAGVWGAKRSFLDVVREQKS